MTLFQLVPILIFALGAGSLADAVDRRRLLMVTQAGLAACSLALVLLALQGSPPVAALFAVAFVAAGLGAVDQPTRSSAIPRLVPPERLPAAIALNQLNFQMASIVGPAVGGILIATIGLAGAYAVDLVSFIASFVALLAIKPLPPLGAVVRPGLAAIREGLRYARDRRAILGSFVIDLNAMIFGMPTALFPVLALDVFGTGPAGLGLMAAAPANARHASASGNDTVTSPNAVIARPQPSTASRIALPVRCTVRTQPEKIAATNAPAAGAAAISPRPAGPVPNTSSARTGKSDVGIPKIIALRSMTNEPSTALRCRV